FHGHQDFAIRRVRDNRAPDFREGYASVHVVYFDIAFHPFDKNISSHHGIEFEVGFRWNLDIEVNVPRTLASKGNDVVLLGGHKSTRRRQPTEALYISGWR